MQNPKVEIWEGAALAKAPSVGAEPAGFVRAAVLRWRDGAPARVVLPGDRAALRVAELWTSGDGVAVAGAAGALTVSTVLADGASVVTTNLAGPDATIPPGPDALVEVVEGDVVAAHAARVAALCAERATSARAPASWRDAPLVLELGDRTAAAVAWRLEQARSSRAVAPIMLGSYGMIVVVVAAAVWGLPGRPPAHINWGPAAIGCLPLLSWVSTLVSGERARRRIRALVPGLEETAITRFSVSRPADYHFWLMNEHDPQIEELCLASDATRATLRELGFSRRGALRVQVDYGLPVAMPLQPTFDRLRRGKAVSEAWMEGSGLALAWADAIADEPEVEFVTLLSDATLVMTCCLGEVTAKELAGTFRSAPGAGVYYKVWRGTPGMEAWDAHKGLVDEVRAKRGATVVPVQTSEDALFLRRLAIRKARAAGANWAAQVLGPSRIWMWMLPAFGWIWLKRSGSADAASVALFVLMAALAVVVVGFAGSRAALATGPKLRTLAELRVLPVARARGGAVGNWLD